MNKWDVVEVWCDFLTTPHYKYCICLCPEQLWFFFVNSNLPQFRKARQVAVTLENWEAPFLQHTSHVDTTSIERLQEHEEAITAALANQAQCHGPVIQAVRTRIIDAVVAHGALTEDEVALIQD